ncbi:MAG: recombinase family protein, partial [Clostridia bacterium]
MKKAVIYARYSSDSQTEQSIEGQVRVCRDYAKQNDILIVDEYIDRATTGTNDNRVSFQQMLHDSSKKQWTMVLVYKLDRFARNKFEAVVNRKKLADNEVELVSAMERIPDTPEGKLMTGVLEEFNQYFSLELAQKVNRGLRESWLKGNYTGGRGKYGYDVVGQKLVINPEEAAIVLEIFTKYAQGYKAADIARNLIARGVRRKDGNIFEQKHLYTILHNSSYTGKTTLQGTVYDNIIPQIITDKLWAVVETINNENKIAPSRKKAIFDYILTGKLVCGNCHKLMNGESGTSHTGDIHYYYVCTARRKKKAKCSTQTIQKQWLEDMVINITTKMLQKENNIHEIATNLFELHKVEASKDSTIKILQRKYADVLKARNNIIKAIEQGIITDSTKDRLCQLEAELSQVAFDIEKEKQHTYTFLTIENIEAYLQTQVYENTTDIEIRKLIVNTFIQEVIV